MPTIKVVKPFGLLLAANEKPVRFEVGEHEVSYDIAQHWYVQEHLASDDAPAEYGHAFDLTTAGRDELTAYIDRRFREHLAGMSDDDLRQAAAIHFGREQTAAREQPVVDDELSGDDCNTEDTGADTDRTGETGGDETGETGEGADEGDPQARGDSAPTRDDAVEPSPSAKPKGRRKAKA